MSASTSPQTELTDPVDSTPRLAIENQEGLAWARFPRCKADGIAVRELFESAMALTAQHHPRLLVDLTGLPMATSGLMGILVQLHKRFLQVGGRVAVAVPDARVRGAFEIANLHLLLNLHPTSDEASQALLA